MLNGAYINMDLRNLPTLLAHFTSFFTIRSVSRSKYSILQFGLEKSGSDTYFFTEQGVACFIPVWFLLCPFGKSNLRSGLIVFNP